MEADLKECRLCLRKQLRIIIGKFPSNNKKYADEQGRLWNGRLCGECNNNRIKNKMQELRKRSELGK